MERFIFGADGHARYEVGNYQGGAENITWQKLNPTTILFAGSSLAVQLRDISGSIADGQFNAESLHTGGGNARCVYILGTGKF